MRSIHPRRRLSALALGTGLGLGISLSAHATIINFDAQGLTGQSTYVANGQARDLNVTAPDGSQVSITGGTVLTNETFLPADHTSLYGTAFFGPTAPNPPNYSPTITLTFASAIQNFFLDVFNGQTFNVTYTVADNAGHSSSFLLIPNLSSGTSQVGFAAAGNVITITSDAGNLWDFSIDNIGFNEALPPPGPTVLPPVYVNVPPPLPTESPDQRKRKGRKGKNGKQALSNGEFDTEASVSSVPEPGLLSLMALGLALLGLRRVMVPQ